MTTKVYVAGPLTTGDVGINITEAIQTADLLWQHGFVPFIPHLMTFYNLQCFHTYEEWMAYDFEWLDACDAVYRIPGRSDGADREVTKAAELHKPVFYSITDICEYYGKRPL